MSLGYSFHVFLVFSFQPTTYDIRCNPMKLVVSVHGRYPISVEYNMSIGALNELLNWVLGQRSCKAPTITILGNHRWRFLIMKLGSSETTCKNDSSNRQPCKSWLSTNQSLAWLPLSTAQISSRLVCESTTYPAECSLTVQWGLWIWKAIRQHGSFIPQH